MMASDGELEGLYRFFNNERVTASAVLAPHYRATLERVRGTGGAWACQRSRARTRCGKQRGRVRARGCAMAGLNGAFAAELVAR
jgi:hypothetical protein